MGKVGMLQNPLKMGFLVESSRFATDQAGYCWDTESSFGEEASKYS